jgi:hypothetical protein
MHKWRYPFQKASNVTNKQHKKLWTDCYFLLLEALADASTHELQLDLSKIRPFQLFLDSLLLLNLDQQQEVLIEELFEDVCNVFTVCIEFSKCFSGVPRNTEATTDTNVNKTERDEFSPENDITAVSTVHDEAYNSSNSSSGSNNVDSSSGGRSSSSNTAAATAAIKTTIAPKKVPRTNGPNGPSPDGNSGDTSSSSSSNDSNSSNNKDNDSKTNNTSIINDKESSDIKPTSIISSVIINEMYDNNITNNTTNRLTASTGKNDINRTTDSAGNPDNILL